MIINNKGIVFQIVNGKKTFDYQKQRDAVSDSQWQKQYELSKKAAASSKSSRSTSKSSGKKSSSSDGLKVNGSNDSLSNNTSDSNIAQILLNKSLETADQMVTDAGKQEFLNRMGNAMQRAVSSGKITEGEMENIVKTVTNRLYSSSPGGTGGGGGR